MQQQMQQQLNNTNNDSDWVKRNNHCKDKFLSEGRPEQKQTTIIITTILKTFL